MGEPRGALELWTCCRNEAGNRVGFGRVDERGNIGQGDCAGGRTGGRRRPGKEWGGEAEAPLGVPAAESGDVRRTRLMVGFGLSLGGPKMRRSSKDLYV
jgi:hypothetical protein